jgi:TolA-binding protein
MRMLSSLMLLAASLVWLAPASLSAQESSESIAARQMVQENMKALNARIEDLEASNHSLRARVDDLRRELQQLREETRKLADQSGVQDQIRRLADSIKDVDNKRRADNEKVLGELAKLAKQMADTPIMPPTPAPRQPSTTSSQSSAHNPELRPASNIPEKGIEYVIKPNDTLSGIVAACRAKDLKVTQKLMREANPDVNWDRLRVGQKIFIPLPGQ